MIKKSHVILKKRADYMNIYDDTLDFLISETRDMDCKCFVVTLFGLLDWRSNICRNIMYQS